MRKLILIGLLIAAKAEAQSPVFAVADSLYAIGDYTKAINAYARSDSERAHLQMARSYTALGRLDKAMKEYRYVLRTDSTAQIAGFELGKLLLKTKAYDEGLQLFSKLIAINATNPEYHYYLAETYAGLDQPASSLNSYKRAIENDSLHLRSLFQLGKYFVAKREKETALSYIDQGLSVYPDDVSLINLKALAYFNNDEYPKALPLFERLVELGEAKEYILSKLAYCYFKNWEFQKAKSVYRQVLLLNDKNADAYYNLGLVYLKEQQTDSAHIHIRRSIEVQTPVLAGEYEALARIERVRDNPKKALEYYQMAHKEAPEVSLLFYNVCTLSDQVDDDPKKVLPLYEEYLGRYGHEKGYAVQMAKKRIAQLREEIHFSAD
ncbi:tetratricopeptide repeat protein [Pseudozobellia thermophila]|uniref:tetratricopeptide repeat protein n=1 Tax=Pseudozobellia thermophila TaxID=192903 RepID=UPI001BAFF565|nr:tetratricopeptide repeat protein [Pseudozobellia thermophila]